MMTQKICGIAIWCSMEAALLLAGPDLLFLNVLSLVVICHKIKATLSIFLEDAMVEQLSTEASRNI